MPDFILYNVAFLGMKKTSLSDIARAMGVSKTLVSLVLNGRGDEVGIKKDTQKRVLEMAKKMNYMPNLLARGLRIGSSRILGLVLPNIANPFFAHIARVVEDEAGKQGYRVMSASSDEESEKEKAIIKMLLERQVDGLILATSLKEKEEIRSLQEEKIPFVMIDRCFPDLQVHSVVVDNHAGAYKVTEHLIEEGFRKIGLVKIGPSHITPIQLRHKGYCDALRNHNIPYDDRLVREIPFGFDEQVMWEAITDMLAPPDGAEALFFLNNDLTVTGLKVIRDMQLQIPRDVAIASYDDLDVFNLLCPPVTAVAQPWKIIARESVRIIMKELNAKKHPVETERVVLPPTIRKRASTRKS